MAQKISMTPIIAYLRVSSKAQAKRYGFVRQLRDIRAFCEREHLQIVEIIKDSYTGQEPLEKRPEGKRITDVLKSRKAKGIVCAKANRIGRIMSDAIITVKTLLKNDWLVYFSDLGQITSEKDIRFVLNVWMAETDLDNLSEQMARGRSDRADEISRGKDKHGLVVGQGGKQGSPYGYTMTRNAETKESRLTINPQQAKVIKRIFAEYIKGHSSRRIASDLNAEGIPAPRMSKWNGQCVVNLMSKEIYMGHVHFGETRYTDPSLAIVTSELWRKAETRRTEQKNHPIKSESYLFAGGRITCICRAFLSGTCRHTRGKTYRYYRCWKKYGYLSSDDRQCDAPMLDADDIEYSVLTWLLGLAIYRDKLQTLIDDMQQKSEHEIEPLRDRLDAINTTLNDTNNQIGRLIKRTATEEDDKIAEGFKVELHRLSELSKELEAKRDKAERDIASFGVWANGGLKAEMIQAELRDLLGLVPGTVDANTAKQTMGAGWKEGDQLVAFNLKSVDYDKARAFIERYDVRVQVLGHDDLRVSCKLIPEPEFVHVFENEGEDQLYNVSGVFNPSEPTRRSHENAYITLSEIIPIVPAGLEQEFFRNARNELIKA